MRKRWVVVHITQATPEEETVITESVRTVTYMGAWRLARDLNHAAIMKGANRKFTLFYYDVLPIKDGD